MKRIICLLLLAAMLLAGCDSAGRSYVHITPHSDRSSGTAAPQAPAQNAAELWVAMQVMVESGMESGVINTVRMDSQTLEQNMEDAVRRMLKEDPVGCFAVEAIHYEVGTTGGKIAAAVTISYRRSALEIKKILHLSDMTQLQQAVSQALENCRPGIVMQVGKYEPMDLEQLVRDIAQSSPQTVMEVPEVAEAVYGTGNSRVIELSFTYENSRETLRQMQSHVRPIFEAAAMYVSGEGSDAQKLSQLYAFLMERFDYTIETSITPAYSLLRHGVGDSRAFATVYAAMCAKAELECLVVTGAKNGEPRTWNIVRDGDRYYHVDLLTCAEHGYYQEMTDAEMNGYVWDYSAYPSCDS